MPSSDRMETDWSRADDFELVRAIQQNNLDAFTANRQNLLQLPGHTIQTPQTGRFCFALYFLLVEIKCTEFFLETDSSLTKKA